MKNIHQQCCFRLPNSWPPRYFFNKPIFDSLHLPFLHGKKTIKRRPINLKTPSPLVLNEPLLDGSVVTRRTRKTRTSFNTHSITNGDS
ncbi:hypothetical protein L2E82_38066 [Cichorium intybus]|uniref:Uncharacterized protein n=1 Tax=Cichorium intybus TaxID=13427 RepID=A0ACB9AFS9_CICIN|nr:hypothetical protein L2E82_38066 [Cichorium intybus]